jgi:hypothetical protein
MKPLKPSTVNGLPCSVFRPQPVNGATLFFRRPFAIERNKSGQKFFFRRQRNLLHKPQTALQDHIDAYVNAYNESAEPFDWTKKKVRQRRFNGRRITQL